MTVRLLLPENGWFWQHVRNRAIKSGLICHRPICICGIEFLSFLPALNPQPEHRPIQISQTGPVHTYSILLLSCSFLLTTCFYWIYWKPHLTSFLAWHILDTAGLVVFTGTVCIGALFHRALCFLTLTTRNVWILILECKSFSHIYDTLCLFKKTADFGWETCVCLHVYLWIVNIRLPDCS